MMDSGVVGFGGRLKEKEMSKVMTYRYLAWENAWLR